jgi:hypothetical protein
VFEQSNETDSRREAMMNLSWSCGSQERQEIGGFAGQQAHRLPFRPPRL